MKLRNLRLALGVAAAALSVGCAGTAGDITREKGLLPKLRSAWVGVEEDFDRGLADGVTDGDIDPTAAELVKADANSLEAALKLSVAEAKAEAHRWPFLDPWAHRGVTDRVDDGEVSPGAAESRHERIRQFAAALIELEG